MTRARASIACVACAIACLACGCDNKAKTDAHPTSKSASPSDLPPVDLSTLATPSVTDAHADANDDARHMVYLWNDALSRHDLDALRALYADEVKLYGSEISRAACVDQKRAAFTKAPNFRQKLTTDAIEVHENQPGHFVARFVKVSFDGKRETAYRAYLGLARSSRAWTIDEESDDTTDEHLAEGCDEAAMSLVSSTAQARAFFDAPLDDEAALRDAGYLGRGGMVMPRAPGEARIAVALHSSFVDRISNEVWFEIDPKTGAVYGLGDDASFTLKLIADPAATRAVVKACTGK